MKKIFITSDLHLCHNRGFIYADRGFNSVEEMNEAIVERWNNVVGAEDTVYVLGDLMLNDNQAGMRLIERLNGDIYVVYGNHDTESCRDIYLHHPKIIGCATAFELKYNGYKFYMSHYPTLTANLEKESLRQCVINLYGHTHQKTNFYNDIPYMYHVGVDSHNCTPVLLDDIIEECKNKVNECKEML